MRRIAAPLAFLILFPVTAQALSAQTPALPTAEDVKALQSKYQTERDEAVKSGAATRFLPILLEKADEMAKKGDGSLAAGRLMQAREAFRQARWQLPYQPKHLPDHVARILGSLRLRHSRGVNGFAFSPDGKFLATAGGDGLVKIWDLGNGHEVLAYAGHGEANYVRFVAYTPDGKTVVSAGSEKDIKVWEAASGKEIASIPGPGPYVTALVLSPDGKQILAGHATDPGSTTQGTLSVYETQTGKRLREDGDFRGRISTLAFHPTGRILAVGDESGQIRLWQFPLMVENPKQPSYWAQQDASGAVYHVGFSPSGNMLARCGASDVKLYQTVQPGDAFQVATPKQTISAPVTQFCSTYSKDGKTLFTGGTDGVIHFWDPDAGTAIGTFRGHSGTVWAMGFNPEGTVLASSSSGDYLVRMWDFDIVSQARDFAGHTASVWMAAFSPDSSKIVSAGADRTLKIWDAVSGKVLHDINHGAPVTAVLFSPDGKTVASAGGDKLVRLWNAETGAPLRTCAGHRATVTALDFNRDGTKLVTGGADRFVKVFGVATGEPGLSVEQPSIVTAVAFSPDGKQFAVGAVDNTIALYDAVSGKLQHRWIAHAEAVTCLTYSPGGQYIASGGADHALLVWPLANRETPIRLPGHGGPISMIAFRKDNQHLVSCGSDQLVKLWKLEGDTGKEVQTFRGHKDWVTSCAFSRDGFHILSSSVDRLVKLWEITTRDLPLVPEHTAAVEAVAFSPDNKLLATGSADHTIRLWDRVTGAEVATLIGHTAPVMGLAFLPDNNTLVSSGGEAAVRLWSTNPARELPRTAAQLQAFSRLRRYSPYIAVEPEGKRLLVWLPLNEGRVSTMIECFDLQQGTQVYSFFEDNRKVNSLSFCANGKLAATGAKDGSVRVWDLEKRPTPTPIPGGDWFFFDKTGVADLALTPDGKTLVATSDDGDVKIGTVADRKVQRELKAHKSRIMGCVASADSKRFATVGMDNIVKLWDIETGNLLRSWDMSGPATNARGLLVVALAFAPDGRHLVSANANTTVYMLELP